jgi:hypothetical protein
MVVGGYIRGLGAKTRRQQGIHVVVFAQAGKILPLVALLLLEDRCRRTLPLLSTSWTDLAAAAAAMCL